MHYNTALVVVDHIGYTAKSARPKLRIVNDGAAKLDNPKCA